ncbi:(2Fe-2S)-binding protein [Yinghuangia sp. ASG 101]|uniref:(2Fe-2S)-binding protein n=1 Tax=Yinghuangia sp. ASG 101 TaxID=2896848 RepID=UPI001E52A181|nr:(2Fe-2S)-binding protein [Yinghuangia sp. ASG 101]UGQ13670.1 (2Fe-2S)-binding protein [Yinghuangia sp. ASG 101]
MESGTEGTGAAAEKAQAALTDWCPEYRGQLVLPPGERAVPAASVLDAAWLGRRVAESARRYRTDDARVAAVLWWYSASTVLVTPALATYVVTRRAVDPRPEATTLHMRPDGLPSGARSAAAIGDGVPDVGSALGAALAAYIAALAGVAPVRPRAAWAVAVDSVAGVLLRAGTTVGEIPRATALAGELVAAAGEHLGERLPLPRYTDVAGARFVRRASCCLIYRAPGQAMCTSCPGRRPEEREADLARFARRFGG